MAHWRDDNFDSNFELSMCNLSSGSKKYARGPSERSEKCKADSVHNNNMNAHVLEQQGQGNFSFATFVLRLTHRDEILPTPTRLL